MSKAPISGECRLESLARRERTNMTASESTAPEATSGAEGSAAALQAELTVIVVTWNTRELTLRCLETLFDNTPDLRMQVIVADNNSEDGSADAIARRFPQVHLIRNPGDFGFARANNVAMEFVDTEWILLLNPDTEVHQNAINNLLAVSKKHPEAGITGGRTVFPDGSLNIASAWNKMTSMESLLFVHRFERSLLADQLFSTRKRSGDGNATLIGMWISFREVSS